MTGDAERFGRWLDEAYAEARAALEGADHDAQVYGDGWTVKDVLGHVVAWEGEGLKALQQHCAGEEYRPDYAADVDQQFYEQRRDFDAARVYAEWEAVREAMKATLYDVPAFDALLWYPWGDTGTVAQLIRVLLAHQREHLDDILAALERLLSPQDDRR